MTAATNSLKSFLQGYPDICISLSKLRSGAFEPTFATRTTSNSKSNWCVGIDAVSSSCVQMLDVSVFLKSRKFSWFLQRFDACSSAKTQQRP